MVARIVNWGDVAAAPFSREWANAIQATSFEWSVAHVEQPERKLCIEGLVTPYLGLDAPGFPLPNQVLGTTCFTQIASHTARVSMPGPPRRDSADPSMMTMPAITDPWLRAADWSGFLDRRYQWGRDTYVHTFRIAVDAGNEDARALAEQVHAELPAWWRRVGEWLELLGDSPVRSVDNFHWSEGSIALYARDDSGIHHVGGKTRIRNELRPLSMWRLYNGWPAAVHLAGLGLAPPMPCSLIVDAIRAHRDGRFRSSVIDAGTACDISLGDALRRAHVEHRDDATLGKLTELVRKHISGLLPDGFYPSLVKVRNDVVHHARVVDNDTAAVALDFAQRVVHSIYPLAEADDAGLTISD
ncbi:MAG: hypothetical protein M3Q98_13305 [Actinomycetota bacterium]|nr:hypothetical protein [Actinomycetota bacterium]